jgi:hypothetical protein
MKKENTKPATEDLVPGTDEESTVSVNRTPFTASPEQIAAWKQKHKEIFELEVFDKKENIFRVYLKKPDRAVVGAATKFGSSDPIKFNDTLFNSCWLDGDSEIKTDDDLYLSASARFADVVEIRETSLKKL